MERRTFFKWLAAGFCAAAFPGWTELQKAAPQPKPPSNDILTIADLDWLLDQVPQRPRVLFMPKATRDWVHENWLTGE